MPDDRRAFLRAIADNPDDDTPRLIYADFVEEHGEVEHAELIRLQCKLASLSAPHMADQLLYRERELLSWTRMDMEPCLIGFCEWVRGFIVAAMVKSEILVECGWVWDRHPIHTVRLRNWRGIDKSMPLNPSKTMWSLKRLEIPARISPTYKEGSWGVANKIRKKLIGVEVGFWEWHPKSDGLGMGVPVEIDSQGRVINSQIMPVQAII